VQPPGATPKREPEGLKAQPDAAPGTAAAAVTNEAAAPTLPALTLQGVVFSRTRPSAVISGKTVFLGDRVRDFRVMAIGQDSATLVGNGRTNVLRLPD
jgi:hypothetical protein